MTERQRQIDGAGVELQRPDHAAGAPSLGGWTTPRANGLPSNRALLAFPALVLVVLAVLVTLGIGGSSSGVMYHAFDTGKDPALVALKPQPVRSDEWNVQTVVTIAQVQLGLPVHGDAMPGGVDMTMLWEVPYAEWSAAFRPHNFGFFVLPFDNAFALKWWLPGAALAIATSMFLVSLWPRRPIAAALVAVGFFCSPFFQWWYIPQTLWPPAWALATMTAVIWMQSLVRPAHRWLWAGGIAYLTVTAALGLYAPFLVPCALIVTAFSAGWVLRSDSALPVRVRLRRFVPLVVAGGAAVLVMVVFVLTRLDTVKNFLGTVYPGQRLTPTGEVLRYGDGAAPFLGAFGLALRDGSSYAIRENSPEASAFVLVGAFLAIVGLWALVHGYRARRFVDYPLVAAMACGLLIAAFLYVPGWDAIAHLVLLDRVPPRRMAMGLGLLSLVLIGLVVRNLDARSLRAPWWVALGAGVASLVAHAGLWRGLSDNPAALAAAGPWQIIVAAFAVSVVLFARGRTALGALVFVVISGAVGGWVNPLYRGAFDLRETDVARVVVEHDQAEPGRWVGVGDAMVGPILTETGVGGFNGFQGAPDRELWEQIDPRDRYNSIWNRFANVSWAVDATKERIFNPANDQIAVNFNSCARYEQGAVEHVLADRPLDQKCLRLEDTVTEPITTYYVYSIAPAPRQ